MSKKIALCLHGIHGGISKGKMYDSTNFDLGINNSSIKVLETAHKYYSKNIESYNDIDIFFHSWDVDLEERLVELYKPKGYRVEQQKKFYIPSYVGDTGGGYTTQRGQAHYSRWYSFLKSNDLKKEYERKNNFKYDLVMQSRFDLCWLDKIVFEEEFNSDFFYTSTPIVSGKKELPDRWFVSDSNKMDKFSEMYYLINDFCNPNSKLGIPQYLGISSHFMVCNFLRNHLNYNIKYKFKYRDNHLMVRDLNE